MATKCHERSMQVQKSLGKNTCLKQTEVICWKYGKTISFSANNYIYSVYRAAASLCCQSRFSEPCTDCVQPHCRWYFASWGPCFHNLTTTGGQGVCVVEIQSEKPQRKEKSAFRQLRRATLMGKVCKWCTALFLSCQGLLQDVKFPSVGKLWKLLISSKDIREGGEKVLSQL